MLPKGFKFTSWRFAKFDSPSQPGCKMKKKYSGRYDSDGRIVLDVVGEEDVYEYIQSFADDVDINRIMEQFNRTKDEDLLNRVKGFYMDVSELPKSWPEVLNIVNYGRSEFEKMPPEFKELYGNDFARFAATFDPSVFDVPSDSGPAVVADPSPVEVKEGE